MMIHKGLALRFNENYYGEINIARALGFAYFQIWFYNGILSASTLPEPREEKIKQAAFPIILHAVFDMPDYDTYGQKLLGLVDFFGHMEVIIHPVCKTEKITEKTVYSLERKISAIHNELKKRRVKLYVENNSVIDGFFNTVEELRVVFDEHPDIGLLLDLAHVNDYDHLRNIVKMRFPECIHIADKRFGVAHEHLELGKGDLNFDMVFSDILTGYSGRVILEAADDAYSVERSKKVIDRLFPV